MRQLWRRETCCRKSTIAHNFAQSAESTIPRSRSVTTGYDRQGRLALQEVPSVNTLNIKPWRPNLCNE